MWLFAAILSALFAGLTAVLSKCGLKHTDSDVATAVRTTVVLVLSWLIVLITGAQRSLGGMDAKSICFLLLSGIMTGASWLCSFRALSVGDVSKVSAVDKSSVVLSALCAMALFPEERTHWAGKIVCLAVIAVGMFLMTGGFGKKEGEKRTWLVYAVLSAVFAAATSVLAKIGIRDVDSNAATAIRTCAVFVTAWLIVLFRKKTRLLTKLNGRETVFLILSGIMTGASWLCFYYAVQNGQVSVVVPIDKLSILVTVLFSLTVFKEKLSLKAWIGLGLLTAATVCMAIIS